FAAGAAALLLEWGIVQGNRYSLNTEVIRQLLIRGTKPVVDTVYPNPSWGWGVLDLARAFELLRSGSGH
ncbi:MAG: peptidase S8, partial [Clostridium sp.]|nr:peptidase S8 [Clostridium sp.]